MTNTAKILIIEDERSIQTVIRTYLENASYTVYCADDGLEGLELFREQNPDLVILDLNLPNIDGLKIASQMRDESDVYILMLTARSEEDDRIAGLKIGADDYMTKPFSPRELVARVEAILRRSRQSDETTLHLSFKHVTLHLDAHEVYAGEDKVDFTPTEFKLLRTLMNNHGVVLSRDQLVSRVWGSNYYGNDRVVDVYVGQVRRKLEEATGKLLIETVRGVGYKFIDEMA
ncbi:MAG: response regulator transcription factor [Chloroflexota bacterium]